MEENTIMQPIESVPEATPSATTTTDNGQSPDQPQAEPIVPTPVEQPEADTQDTTAEQPSTDSPTDSQTEPAVPEIDYSQFSREELKAALESLLGQDIQKIRKNVTDIRTRFNDLNREVQRQAREAFLAAGGDKDAYQEQNDPLAEAFYALYATYRQRRQKLLADLEVQKQKNLEAKQALIEELRVLVESGEEQVRTVMDKYNGIQERWKAIGDVPRERMNDLWQSYHFQIEQFFKKLEMNRELRTLDQKRNLEQKLQLCEQAEELIVETSIQKAFKTLQELRLRWKEIGPVPADQNEEIWQRFQAAAAKIDQRRLEYYEQRKEEFDNNLLAKQALIDKATELTAVQPQSAKEWNELTAQLDQLLTDWKTIGPVTREANEDIWSRFKGIIDRHYEEKKEYFGAIRDEQTLNYQKKLDLCLKAEAIAKRDDWKRATDELLQLQKEWKTIGPTSRKVSEKVWQRFRAACDDFFRRKGEYFNERHASEGENLEKKEALLRELREHTFGDSKEENLTFIKDIQRRWLEVGYVPMAEKERLQKEFRDLLDHTFEQLKLSAREAEETAYREHLNSLVSEGKHIFSGERQALQEKLDKLRADLNLWENNLGFLASSKQADLLKQEFEKKMQGARQQIALLQAKLRILSQTENKANTEQDKQ